ncbi:MAG: hydrogenase [Roseateles depolymerans]|uniref:Hydrogenase n=1 Tax=Roseateles depolymerans TaxID=76731 RepID=A0A2W5FN31_9BURK|nr:MAG: hydrogenase [Roseateles depolymerans]
MCIGLPVQVLQARPGHARVFGRGREFEVNTALVGDCRPGDWLLIFLDSARERLCAERAAEVDAALDLVEQALAGPASPAGPAADPGFALPSALSAAQLMALTGSAASS